MDWKHFLKPGWRKIVIFTIFLFYILNRILSVNYCPTNAIPWCDISYTMPWENPCSGHCAKPDLLTSIIIEIYYPLFTIVSYIISCLIVWIYDKFRKKQK